MTLDSSPPDATLPQRPRRARPGLAASRNSARSAPLAVQRKRLRVPVRLARSKGSKPRNLPRNGPSRGPVDRVLSPPPGPAAAAASSRRRRQQFRRGPDVRLPPAPPPPSAARFQAPPSMPRRLFEALAAPRREAGAVRPRLRRDAGRGAPEPPVAPRSAPAATGRSRRARGSRGSWCLTSSSSSAASRSRRASVFQRGIQVRRAPRPCRPPSAASEPAVESPSWISATTSSSSSAILPALRRIRRSRSSCSSSPDSWSHRVDLSQRRSPAPPAAARQTPPALVPQGAQILRARHSRLRKFRPVTRSQVRGFVSGELDPVAPGDAPAPADPGARAGREAPGAWVPSSRSRASVQGEPLTRTRPDPPAAISR